MKSKSQRLHNAQLLQNSPLWGCAYSARSTRRVVRSKKRGAKRDKHRAKHNVIKLRELRNVKPCQPLIPAAQPPQNARSRTESYWRRSLADDLSKQGSGARVSDKFLRGLVKSRCTEQTEFSKAMLFGGGFCKIPMQAPAICRHGDGASFILYPNPKPKVVVSIFSPVIPITQIYTL